MSTGNLGTSWDGGGVSDSGFSKPKEADNIGLGG